MSIGMAINSNADIDAKREILSRLQDLALLAAEVDLWFGGRPGALLFSDMATVIKQNIRDKEESKQPPDEPV